MMSNMFDKRILGKEVAIGNLYIDLGMDESEEYQVLAIDLKKAPLTQIEKRMPYRDKFIDNILKSAQASGDGGLGGEAWYYCQSITLKIIQSV